MQVKLGVTNGSSPTMAEEPDPQVVPKAERRRFSTEYKLRILKAENGQVTFRYQDGRTRQQRTCTLSAEAFIHRFLQHVLPKGFVKVRYYGLLAPGNRKRLAQARRLLGRTTATTDEPHTKEENEPQDAKEITCPHCGQPMIIVQRIQPRARWPP